jgi:hypothetical protein
MRSKIYVTCYGKLDLPPKFNRIRIHHAKRLGSSKPEPSFLSMENSRHEHIPSYTNTDVRTTHLNAKLDDISQIPAMMIEQKQRHDAAGHVPSSVRYTIHVLGFVRNWQQNESSSATTFACDSEFNKLDTRQVANA